MGLFNHNLIVLILATLMPYCKAEAETKTSTYPLQAPYDYIHYVGEIDNWTFNETIIQNSDQYDFYLGTNQLWCANKSGEDTTDEIFWKRGQIMKDNYFSCPDSVILDKLHLLGQLRGVKFEELYEKNCMSDKYCRTQCNNELSSEIKSQIRGELSDSIIEARAETEAMRNMLLEIDKTELCKKHIMAILPNQIDEFLNTYDVLGSNRHTRQADDSPSLTDDQIKDHLFEQYVSTLAKAGAKNEKSTDFKMVPPVTSCQEDFFCSTILDHSNSNENHIQYIPDPDDSGLSKHTTNWADVKDAISKMYVDLKTLPNKGELGNLVGDSESTWFSGAEKGFEQFSKMNGQQEVSYDTAFKILIKLQLDQLYENRALHVYLVQSISEQRWFNIANIVATLVCVTAVLISFSVFVKKCWMIKVTKDHKKIVSSVLDSIPGRHGDSSESSSLLGDDTVPNRSQIIKTTSHPNAKRHRSTSKGRKSTSVKREPRSSSRHLNA